VFAEDFLIAAQHPAVEARDVRRQPGGHVQQQAMQAEFGFLLAEHHLGPGEVVGVEQVELLHRQVQPERIPRSDRPVSRVLLLISLCSSLTPRT
jgi:hypothetical protein